MTMLVLFALLVVDRGGAVVSYLGDLLGGPELGDRIRAGTEVLLQDLIGFSAVVYREEIYDH